MDLPPDKARVLKNYSDDKKWDLVCDQVNMHAFTNKMFKARIRTEDISLTKR